MKKLFYSFAILMALVGCSEDPATGGNENGGEEPAPETAVTFTATMEAIGEEELAWPEGDAISVFRSVANEKFVYNATNAKFEKADNSNPTAKTPYFYGIHPYSTISSSVSSAGKVTTSIPSQQNYAAGSFNFAQLPMIAVAEKDATELEFKNLCGFLCVKIYGNAGIKSVEIKGNNNESLAGSVAFELAAGETPSVSMGTMGAKDITLKMDGVEPLGATAEEAKEFWFIVAPTTFSKGLSVAVVDEYDNTLRKNYSGEIVISRNEVTALTEVMEVKAKIPTKTILDVKFNEDGTATDAGIYNLNVELVDGSAVSVYKHSGYEANNIARFDNIRINNDPTDHSYYLIDYSENEEFKATIADGFTWEIVSLSTFSTDDWWLSPGGSDAFSFVFKDYRNNYAWNFVSNHGGGWFAGGTQTEATYEFNKYNHDLYIYDANLQAIQIYHNGVLCGTKNEVTTFNPGSIMTIGGRAATLYDQQTNEEGEVVKRTYTGTDGFYMQWNGEVAMYRVYDQALTEEEIAEKYNSLVLPEASEAPIAAIGTPLLDVQWNADKTATNVGTQTGLEIAGYPNDLTKIVNVEGYGNVVDFNDAPENHWWEDGWYRIDYSANEEFKSKLQDGFSFEILCVADHNPGDFYSRPAASDTWGIHLRCNVGGSRHYWQIFKGGNNVDWWNLGDTKDTIGAGGAPIFSTGENGVKMEKYSHIVYTYNAEVNAVYVFIDGVSAGGWFNVGEFNVGNVFGICGMPAKVHGDGVLRNQHRWPGKIATVRIYDEALSVDQIAKRYQDLQPTIEKLTPTIGQ